MEEKQVVAFTDFDKHAASISEDDHTNEGCRSSCWYFTKANFGELSGKGRKPPGESGTGAGERGTGALSPLSFSLENKGCHSKTITSPSACPSVRDGTGGKK